MLSTGLTKVLGVELCHNGSGQYSCRSLELHRKGNELEIIGKKITNGPLGKILESLPKATPIAFVLSGKGIVHKNANIQEGGTDHIALFRSTFSSIEIKDFYIQQYTGEANVCLSIARRDMVGELLDKLKRAGLQIYSLSLGGPVAVHVLPQLNRYGDEMVFDGHCFALADKQFQAYSFNTEFVASFPLKMGEEVIAEELIVAYAAAFQLMLHEQLPMVIADVEEVNTDFRRLVSSQQWKKRTMLFLFGLFALLLVSFGMFSHYNQQNERLLKEVGAQTSSAEQMELLQQHIVKQEQLLKQLNWNGGYNYGFLLNEIGRSMPRQLNLLGVAMNDFKTEQEKSERVSNIRIKGITGNLTAVNNWIFVLREKTWVKSAKLLKFQEEQEGDQYQFDILINY